MIHNLFILITDCFYYKITKYYIGNHGILVIIYKLVSLFVFSQYGTQCLGFLFRLCLICKILLRDLLFKNMLFFVCIFFLGGGGGGGGGNVSGKTIFQAI